MSIKFRLTAMQFLQFFVWGAWLISLGGYMGGTLHFEGGQIGAIFATMGIASLIMPGLYRYHRRQMDKRRTPLWHTPPHRCRCSDLCFNCHHIQPHVLGHAAQHACLHAYTISGQHRILQCIGKI